jgi:molybdopterin/thiamine biosynthesis adenylyltransferase
MKDTAKPKKKETVIVSELEGTLYFRKPGYVVEVPDPSGSIQYLLELMDGARTVDQLHEELAARYPDVDRPALTGALRQLDDSGFLEDAVATAAGLLDDHELGRWERNLLFLEAFTNTELSKYELQHRIKNAKVALLGLGGIGSHLLYDLAAMGVGDIRAADGDNVELSNLNRQILYTEGDIGRPKAEVAAERVQAFNPRLQLEILPLRLSSTDDVLRVIRDRDYVLCVADQPRTEIIGWVNEACVRERPALIIGGHEMERVVYYTIVPGITGCMACWLRQVEQHDALSADLIDERRRAQIFLDIGVFAPPVSIVAGLMLCELTRLITRIEPPVATGQLIEFRFESSLMRQAERWDRLADCPVCQNVEASSAHRWILAEGSHRAANASP